MARPRQPIDLLIMKGNKHLTKSEIAERKSNEIKANYDKVKPPSYLPANLKKEFNKISKELLNIGIISNLDVDSLASFLMARQLYLNLTQQLLENPNLILENEKIVTQQDKFYKQMRSSAMDLGLTISSRCKLVIPKKEENKAENKFSKFM